MSKGQERLYITKIHGFLKESCKNYIIDSHLINGELTLQSNPKKLLPLMSFLKKDNHCLFEMLIDLCGVDYPAHQPRFRVITHLCSLKHNIRIRVRIDLDEDTALPSLTELWPAAGWFERECWDMYGIFFKNHPDLRRILSDYGFQGHALRKDFPLSGYTQTRYDEEQRRVVSEPVNLVQEYRDFDFMSPWEGSLPGDEKATDDPEKDKA